MNVTYQDKDQQRAADRDLLQEATKCLEEVAGPSESSVSAQWHQNQDTRGCALYTLTLSDFREQVSASFSADELRSPRRLRPRLLELWGDFLQLRSEAQLKKLEQLVAQGV